MKIFGRCWAVIRYLRVLWLQVAITYKDNVFDKRADRISEPTKNPSTYINTTKSIKSQQLKMPQSSNEGKILLALQALQNDPKLSMRHASQIYEVGYSTLRDRRHGRQSRRDIMPNSRKLSTLEEEVLLQSILDQIS
jgi:hypothetical protein